MLLAAVADVLVDAALVLGGDAVLKILYVKLMEVLCLTFASGFSLFSPVISWRILWQRRS